MQWTVFTCIVVHISTYTKEGILYSIAIVIYTLRTSICQYGHLDAYNLFSCIALDFSTQLVDSLVKSLKTSLHGAYFLLYSYPHLHTVESSLKYSNI